MILGDPLLCRGPRKHHLKAKVSPGFVVKSNTYNNFGDESMLLTSILQEHLTLNATAKR